MKSRLTCASRTRIAFSAAMALGAFVALLTATGLRAVEPEAVEKTGQLQAPTHRQVRLIQPRVDGQSVRLHTIATTPEGHIVAGVEGDSGAVLLLNSDGETLQQWSLELSPTAVAVAPDGTIYVGGSGKIAQLGPQGTVDRLVDSPHVGNVEELRKKAADSIRSSRARLGAAYERQIDLLKERSAVIEEKDEADRSNLEKAQLKAYQTQLESLERMMGAGSEGADVPDAQLNAAVMRTMNVTSMAASDDDLFICAYDPGGSGYSVWRVDRELGPEASEVIMDGLRGCCGQMDIQCCDDQLIVSENTRFKIGIYDRHGRAQASFGGRDRTSRAGFGSCCNPMNSLPLKDGTILTAESSIGHIKRFDTDGNLIAYIGKAGIGGGCKHCALAHDPKNDLYFMMYQDKNAICVLANNESTPMTLAEQQRQQRQNDFLAKAAGTWNLDGKKDEGRASSGLLSLFGGGRGGSSQQPVASLKLDSAGNAKILEGMYKAYGDDASIELLPKNDDSDTTAFALAIDQVRFLEGTWRFSDAKTAKVAFQGMAELTFKRDASADTCAGKDCENPDCEDGDCPQHSLASEQTERLFSEELYESEQAGLEEEVIR
jgi:hypothetical protein